MDSAKSLPCRLDARHGSFHTNPSLIYIDPHLHLRLAKLRCGGNGGDHIGWQEGMEEE